MVESYDVVVEEPSIVVITFQSLSQLLAELDGGEPARPEAYKPARIWGHINVEIPSDDRDARVSRTFWYFQYSESWTTI